jgi:hypothetical protein
VADGSGLSLVASLALAALLIWLQRKKVLKPLVIQAEA